MITNLGWVFLIFRHAVRQRLNFDVCSVSLIVKPVLIGCFDLNSKFVSVIITSE